MGTGRVSNSVNTNMAHSVSASAYSGYGGMIAVSGIVNAPAAGRAIMNAARANPGAVETATNFIEGAVTPYAPATTAAGVIGAVTAEYGPSIIRHIGNPKP